MLDSAESVACIEMPKGIIRLVPDVALGAKNWAFFDRALRLAIHRMVVGLGRPAAKRTMVNFPGRDRRRRVLKEEVLAASATHSASQDDDALNDAPRYSDAAGVEHHPQITDFVPRRYRTIATFVLVGTIVTGALSALQVFVVPLAEAKGLKNAGSLGVAGAGGLASWFSAVLLIVASITCLITYSIRRHRIDDFRGRYRVWRGATLACLMMSAISVTGLHHTIAAGLTQLTGWSALHDGAIWWFVLPGLPMSWVGIRALLDVRECRLATTLLAAAAISYAASAVTYLGLAPIASDAIRSTIVGAAILMGHWFLLAGAVSYARFVILDAQGLIPNRAKPTKRKDQVDDEELEQLTRPTSTPTTAMKPAVAASMHAAHLAKAVEDTDDDDSEWVDGSRPDRRHYDDDEEDEESSHGGRKLSKADRKRLRRLKADGRAA